MQITGKIYVALFRSTFFSQDAPAYAREYVSSFALVPTQKSVKTDVTRKARGPKFTMETGARGA